MNWFKWWHGTVADGKLGWVARRSGLNVAEVVGVWACLLEHASGARTLAQRGDVSGFDCDAADVTLGLPEGASSAVLNAMRDKGLIDGGRVAKWTDRQKRDASKDRMAAKRQREAEARKLRLVTGCDASRDDVTLADKRRA